MTHQRRSSLSTIAATLVQVIPAVGAGRSVVAADLSFPAARTPRRVADRSEHVNGEAGVVQFQTYGPDGCMLLTHRLVELDR
jgi:hypothetical protein